MASIALDDGPQRAVVFALNILTSMDHETGSIAGPAKRLGWVI